jgi:hypothetical protein
MWTLWESRVLCEISKPLWARSLRPQGGSVHIVFDLAEMFNRVITIGSMCVAEKGIPEWRLP